MLDSGVAVRVLETQTKKMPVEYEIDVKRRLLVTRATGTLTDSELIALQKRILADVRLRPDFDQLGDYRGVSSRYITSRCVRGLASTTLLGPTSRRAFVSDQPDAYGLLRVYQQLADGPEEIEVFRDIESAIMWLGRSPSS